MLSFVPQVLKVWQAKNGGKQGELPSLGWTGLLTCLQSWEHMQRSQLQSKGDPALV